MFIYTSDIASIPSHNPDFQPTSVKPRQVGMLPTTIRNGRISIPKQNQCGYVGKTHKTKNKIAWKTSRSVPKFDVSTQLSFYVNLIDGKEYRINLKKGNLIVTENIIHNPNRTVLGTFKTVYGTESLKFYPTQAWYTLTSHLENYSRLMKILEQFEGCSPYFKVLDIWRQELATLKLKLDNAHRLKQNIRNDATLTPQQKNIQLKQLNTSTVPNLETRIIEVENTLVKHQKKLSVSKKQELIVVYQHPEIRESVSRDKTHSTNQQALSRARPGKKERQARSACLRNGQVLDV